MVQGFGGPRRDWAYTVYVDDYGSIYAYGGYEVEPGNSDAMIIKMSRRDDVPRCSLMRPGTLELRDVDLPVLSAAAAATDITSSTTTEPLPISSRPVTEASYVMPCEAYVGGRILAETGGMCAEWLLASLMLSSAAMISLYVSRRG